MRQIFLYVALIAVVLTGAFMGCNRPEFGFDALAAIVTTPDATDYLALREGNVNKYITASNLRVYALADTATIRAGVLNDTTEIRNVAVTSSPTTVIAAALDLVYTADTVVLDSSRNLTVWANSASNVVLITVPTAPTFEQQILVLGDYTATNKIYLAGGVVDSFTADGAKMLVYDLGNTTWRKLALE